MKKLCLFLGAVTLLTSALAHSSIISYGSYSHDTDTDIVVGDGLEWLQWDMTLGMSWNQATGVLDTIEGGGWSIATNVQMADLFNNFNFGITFDSSENDDQIAITGIQDDGITDDISENDVSFVTMFGHTYPSSQEFLGLFYTAAYYGADPGSDGRANVAAVNDDYYYTGDSVSPAGDYEGAASLFPNWSTADYSLPVVGVALVRSVPEPSIFMLMCAGLFGLGIARRRRLMQA